MAIVAQGDKFDLLLADMAMPEMAGIELIRSIRRQRSARELPAVLMTDAKPVHIIALTAEAMVGDRKKCIEAGMNDYLSKPLRVEEMRAALKRFVQK